MRPLAIQKASLRFPACMALLTVLSALGLAAIVFGFIEGHEEVYHTGPGVPWGILISTYVFFVVSSTGMCLVSSLGHVFGMEKFEPIGRQAIFLAIVLLLSGFLAIASELERPWRLALYMLITPNPTSAIWWMGTLYMLYFVFMALELFFLCRAEILRRLRASSAEITIIHRALLVGEQRGSRDALNRNLKLARLIGATGVVSAVAAHSTLGAVFGFIGSRALWHGPFLPVYFILSAFVSGSAILALAIVLTHKAVGQKLAPQIGELVLSLGRFLLLFLGIFLFFTSWKLVTAQYGRMPGEFESLMVLINGPLALPFWTGEILLGLLAPLFILIYTRARKVWGVTIASLLVILGLFAARYNFVVAGQLVPVMGRETLWQYTPSGIEMLIVLGVFALCLLLYSLGHRFLPLESTLETVEVEAAGAASDPEPNPDGPGETRNDNPQATG